MAKPSREMPLACVNTAKGLRDFDKRTGEELFNVRARGVDANGEGRVVEGAVEGVLHVVWSVQIPEQTREPSSNTTTATSHACMQVCVCLLHAFTAATYSCRSVCTGLFVAAWAMAPANWIWHLRTASATKTCEQP